jgi:hypothetical protein
LLPRDKALLIISFYKMYFCKTELSVVWYALCEFLIFLYIFSNTGNDIAVISNLPQYEDSIKNIDMGQRNQIRGQREREREKEAAAWRRNHTQNYLLAWQCILSLLSIIASISSQLRQLSLTALHGTRTLPNAWKA